MNSIIVHGYVARVDLPGLAINGDRYLYTTKYNYVDLNADENGIWAIYATQYSKNTHVVKVNPNFPNSFVLSAKQIVCLPLLSRYSRNFCVSLIGYSLLLSIY